MKHWLLPLIMLLPVLAGCASPTFQMTPAQVRALSDDEVCAFKNNYRDETKLEAEIARRNLNCDRFYRECLSRGNAPGSQAMSFCMDLLRENERLKYDSRYDRIHNQSGIYTGVGFGF